MELRQDAEYICKEAICSSMPREAMNKAFKDMEFSNGRYFIVSVGKAAWEMAKSAHDFLGEKINKGIIITKYDHIKGDFGQFEMFETGHPVPDDNSFRATRRAIELVSGLSADDTVLFLLSGGGSALFESPLISREELMDITNQLLACGADITEINTIRKRLSGVKGGKFARICMPAKVISIILSDIIGDPPDMIASGPAYPDKSTSAEAIGLVQKYDLKISEEAMTFLQEETPKTVENTRTIIIGGVGQLCSSAADISRSLGYKTEILTASLTCEAREAGAFLASIAQYHAESKEPLAFIAGGETIVHLTGKGKGGRNQELALGAAEGLAGIKDAAVISVGSDGTDGPTDAAGGYVDGSTQSMLEDRGIKIYDVLKNNDAYHALEACGGLIKTGATGTNVNDISILLVKR